MTIKQIHHLFLKNNTVTTDTRKITPNSIYFALKGEKFNGNTFANQAIEKGASYVVIDETIPYSFEDNRYILVQDVLATLQELASFHRDYLAIPIIGLTGSNGKTTTKELINSVLKTTYNVTATVGNLNNHIGVPLTLLSMTNKTEIGIVEMGANHQKEIEFLCEIAKPNYGYITNFGKAHLEGFGGIEGVIKGKSELYTYLKQNHQTAFINEDDQLQKELSQSIKSVRFGTSEAATTINLNALTPFVSATCSSTTINSHLIGNYNFNNIAAAICIGLHFKINIETIKSGIENYVPNNNRSQIIELNTNKIILDAYNANPSSMEVALDNFSQLTASKKTIILGDMFELGESSNTEHQNIIKQALKLNFDTTIFIGAHFNAQKDQFKSGLFYADFDTFKSEFHHLDLNNHLILIKGSRGMALERTLQLL